LQEAPHPPTSSKLRALPSAPPQLKILRRNNRSR
jgi:hypothetical protein